MAHPIATTAALAALLVERDAEVARVVRLIREHAPRESAGDQFLREHDVVALPLGSLEREWQAERVDDQVHLRSQAST